jgi:hypothetical protein
VDATVWKAVDAERCPSRLGRGRWKRAGARYHLKRFQAGLHTLQYLASCLLYFQNKLFEMEKNLHSQLANIGRLVYNQTSSTAYSCSNDDTLT